MVKRKVKRKVTPKSRCVTISMKWEDYCRLKKECKDRGDMPVSTLIKMKLFGKKKAA